MRRFPNLQRPEFPRSARATSSSGAAPLVNPLTEKFEVCVRNSNAVCGESARPRGTSCARGRACSPENASGDSHSRHELMRRCFFPGPGRHYRRCALRRPRRSAGRLCLWSGGSLHLMSVGRMRCDACGSVAVVQASLVAAAGPLARHRLELRRDLDPSALLRKETVTSGVEVAVCADCGRVHLYATDLAQLAPPKE